MVEDIGPLILLGSCCLLQATIKAIGDFQQDKRRRRETQAGESIRVSLLTIQQLIDRQTSRQFAWAWLTGWLAARQAIHYIILTSPQMAIISVRVISFSKLVAIQPFGASPFYGQFSGYLDKQSACLSILLSVNCRQQQQQLS